MAYHHHATLQPDKLILGPVAARLGIPGLLVGAIALILAAYLGLHAGDPDLKVHFFHSYLTAYCFFLAITLGCLCFVLIHHATRAGWSTVVRRIAEGLSKNFVLLAILFIPILLNANVVLQWLNPGVVANDPVLVAKSGYVNPTFLYIRLGLYFLIWLFTAYFFAGRSIRQDHTGDPKLSRTMELFSFPCIILFGFSLTGFAFDWIMGLNPRWFSTIFGVYVFAGCMLSAYATITLVSLALQKRGRIGPVINHDHYHDLGKWMFAFTFFWGYIGFSQYMLTWYSNIPEETQFYIPRQIDGWASVAILLLIVHFIIPFPALLSRHVKRKNAVIAFWAVWCLLACAIDMFWMIMPSEWIRKIPQTVGHPELALQNALPYLLNRNEIYHVRPEYADFYHNQISYAFRLDAVAITVLCFIGFFGLYLFSTMLNLRGNSLVPTKDPRLEESLAFENV